MMFHQTDDFKKRLKEIQRKESERQQILELNRLKEWEDRQKEIDRIKTLQVDKRNASIAAQVGYVYLVRTLHDATLFKIGRTGNPDNRRETFGIQLPFAIEYECLIHTQNMGMLERQFHAKFDEKRLEGEWFRLTTSDVNYIKSLAQTT